MIVVKIIGGLGNQLFQYASCRALSIYLNTEMKLDLSFYLNTEYEKVYRLDKFNLPVKNAEFFEYIKIKNKLNAPFVFRKLNKFGIKIRPYYKKNHIYENELSFIYKMKNNSKIDYYLDGWFNNPNNFSKYRKIILNDLNLDSLLNKENLKMQTEIRSNNSISIHIRRKDYLTNSYFKSLPKEYYLEAIKQIKICIDNPFFYFFSDDIEWTKSTFSSIQNARFVDNNSISESKWSTIGDIEDLMLMRSCKHQIIANSTFSWWGAWLNENPLKQVYYPATWYNDTNAQKQFDENSFTPNEWIKIKF